MIICRSVPRPQPDPYLHINYVTVTLYISHFYFNRIAHLWNVLPPIDTTSSLSTIKQYLSAYLWNYFFMHFD